MWREFYLPYVQLGSLVVAKLGVAPPLVGQDINLRGWEMINKVGKKEKQSSAPPICTTLLDCF